MYHVGTIFNALTQSMLNAVGPGPTAELVQLAGQPLPAAAQLPTTYDPLRAPQIEVRDLVLLISESLRRHKFTVCRFLSYDQCSKPLSLCACVL